VGIAGAVWANSVISTATAQFMNECMGYPFQGGMNCPNLLATMGTYGTYQWLFIVMGLAGTLLLILSAVLPMGAVPPAVGYMPGYMPMPAPPPVPSAPTAAPPPTAVPMPSAPWPPAPQAYPCARCGHRLEWSSDYDRWHCPNCGAWA
jgi:hypothetical protein